MAARGGDAWRAPRRLWAAGRPGSWPTMRRAVVTASASLSAAILLTLGWRGADWPAQVYRVEFFRAHGWAAFDTGWYGGHYPLAYSVLYPLVAAHVGLAVLAVASVGGATWAFDSLVGDHLGSGGAVASGCFAAGACLDVAIGQLPFLFGVALGLVCLVAVVHERRPVAVVAAVLCALASPIAAVFTVAGVAVWAAGSPRRRRSVMWVAAGLLAPLAATAALYPQTGRFPFTAKNLMFALAVSALVWTITPVRLRAVRVGAVAYAAAAVLLFAFPTPVGGNVVRLAVNVGLPIVVGCAALAPRRLLALAAVPLLAWHWSPAVGAVASASVDPSQQASYFRRVLTELSAAQSTPARVEVPFTKDHWEAAWMAPRFPLARGWYRQLDIADNPLFYDKTTPLTADAYHTWLNSNGVTWVALPDVALDSSAQAEAALLRAGQPFLRPVWADSHWQLWQVVDSPGLVTGSATLDEMSANRFSLRFAEPGTATVRVRYTSHWGAVDDGGCVAGTVDGWTQVTARQTGLVTVTAGELPVQRQRC